MDQILEKNGATIVRKEKWDERKLSYEIRGHRRATYYLVYFNAPDRRHRRDQRATRASTETIIRHLILGLDEPIDDHVKKRAAKERERLAEENRKNALAAGWGEPRGRAAAAAARDGGEDDVPDVTIDEPRPRP